MLRNEGLGKDEVVLLTTSAEGTPRRWTAFPTSNPSSTPAEILAPKTTPPRSDTCPSDSPTHVRPPRSRGADGRPGSGTDAPGCQPTEPHHLQGATARSSRRSTRHRDGLILRDLDHDSPTALIPHLLPGEAGDHGCLRIGPNDRAGGTRRRSDPLSPFPANTLNIRNEVSSTPSFEAPRSATHHDPRSPQRAAGRSRVRASPVRLSGIPGGDPLSLASSLATFRRCERAPG